MDIEKFWNEAVSYDEYLIEAEKRYNDAKINGDKDYEEYYRLGLQRMNRMWDKYVPDEEQKAILKSINFDGKILVITEPWCGDASQVVPILPKFFDNIEVRYTYRDQEPSLIDDFLTNGGKSIPVVLLLDKEFNVINHWGPRPKQGKELLERYKADPVAFPKDRFYVELQTYYAKNRGFDTIAELLELI